MMGQDSSFIWLIFVKHFFDSIFENIAVVGLKCETV